MRDRQPELLGLLARQGDDLRELLRRELPRGATTGLVGENIED
jgi:hypothetical protein